MTRFLKLIVVGMLAGTLGIVGCGDDETTGTGGGGTGGAGGDGGQGGSASAPACGEGESLDETFTTDTKLVTCSGMGVIDVPFNVTLAVKPMGDIIDGTSTDYEVQVEFEISEATVDSLGGFVQTAGIGESSTDVDDGEEGTSVNVPATVPCSVDFTEDTDDNGAAGPVIVTTPVVTQAWTATAEGVQLNGRDITLDIASPLPLPLSTKGEDPQCAWDETDGFPIVTFDLTPQ